MTKFTIIDGSTRTEMFTIDAANADEAGIAGHRRMLRENLNPEEGFIYEAHAGSWANKVPGMSGDPSLERSIIVANAAGEWVGITTYQRADGPMREFGDDDTE